MKKIKTYPTREYLLECFDYKKETGELFWKKRPYSHFEDKRVWRMFNKKYAGKKAGCIGYIIQKDKKYQRNTVVINGKNYQVHNLIIVIKTNVHVVDNFKQSKYKPTKSGRKNVTSHYP